MSIRPMKAGRRLLGAALVAAAMLGTTVAAQADFFDRPGFRGSAEIVEVRGGRDWDDEGRHRGHRQGWGHHRHHDHWGHHHGSRHRHHHHGGYRSYRGW